MVRRCGDNGVILMDGVMFMHHDRLAALLTVLRDPIITGPVKLVRSTFSFNGSADFLANDVRVKADGDPLGCLGDLGWYCIRIALMAFLGVEPSDLRSGRQRVGSPAFDQYPRVCTATCSKWTADGKIPLEMAARVGFSSLGHQGDLWDRSLEFDCSFLMPFRQSFEIVTLGDGRLIGDKIVRCQDFVIPTLPSSASFQVESHPASSPLGDLACRVFSAVEDIETLHCNQASDDQLVYFNCLSGYVVSCIHTYIHTYTGGANVYSLVGYGPQ
jgi:hypothetical protein